MTGELLRRQERQVGEEVAHVLVTGVEALGDRVDLGAVAGREHDGLRQVLSRAQIVEDLGQPGVVDGRPLEQVEWCGAVVQPDDDDRHAWRRSLASARWPSRISSSIPESRARFQPSPSVERPSARSSARAAASRSIRTSYSGPNSPSYRRRNHDASAGLAPPVENVTISGPRRIRAGNVNVQRSGSSAALTQMPADSLSSWTCPFTAGSPVAAMTSR